MVNWIKHVNGHEASRSMFTWSRRVGLRIVGWSVGRRRLRGRRSAIVRIDRWRLASHLFGKVSTDREMRVGVFLRRHRFHVRWTGAENIARSAARRFQYPAKRKCWNKSISPRHSKYWSSTITKRKIECRTSSCRIQHDPARHVYIHKMPAWCKGENEWYREKTLDKGRGIRSIKHDRDNKQRDRTNQLVGSKI